MDVTNGNRTTRTGGIHFNHTGKTTNIEFSTSLEGRVEDITSTNEEYEEMRIGNAEFRTAATNSSALGNNPGKSKDSDLKWNANISLPLSKVYVEFTPYFNYTKSKNKNEYSYTYEMKEGTDYLPLYRRTDLTDGHKELFRVGGTLFSTIKSPMSGKNYDFNLSLDYRHVNHKAQSMRSYYYPEAESHEEFKWKESYPEMYYKYDIYIHRNILNLTRPKQAITMDMNLGYTQTYVSSDKIRFDFDGNYNLNADASYLPSFWMHYGPTLNAERSFQTASLCREYWFAMNFQENRNGKWEILSNATMHIANRKYTRYMNILCQSLQRTNLRYFINGSITHIPSGWQLFYNSQSVLAPMERMSRIIDTTDPYTVYMGKENLKSQISHRVGILRTEFKSKRQRTSLISAYWEKTHHAIGYEMDYSPSSNEKTYTARNIDGNWNAKVDFQWGQAIDKNDKILLSTTSSLKWKHSVDYSQVDLEEMTRSVVDNMQATGNLSLTYSTVKGYRIGLKGDFTYYWQKAQTRSYKNHAIDYDYGITLSIPFNSHLDFETDMLAYTRAAYSDKSLNSTDWVWNASLSYAWGKQKQWLVRAMGFDILHQLSSVKRVINEQGFTETRYNTVPSYALLTLVYRFNKAPKGQK